jgi:hypothetical protein
VLAINFELGTIDPKPVDIDDLVKKVKEELDLE